MTPHRLPVPRHLHSQSMLRPHKAQEAVAYYAPRGPGNPGKKIRRGNGTSSPLSAVRLAPHLAYCCSSRGRSASIRRAQLLACLIVTRFLSQASQAVRQSARTEASLISFRPVRANRRSAARSFEWNPPRSAATSASTWAVKRTVNARSSESVVTVRFFSFSGCPPPQMRGNVLQRLSSSRSGSRLCLSTFSICRRSPAFQRLRVSSRRRVRSSSRLG